MKNLSFSYNEIVFFFFFNLCYNLQPRWKLNYARNTQAWGIHSHCPRQKTQQPKQRSQTKRERENLHTQMLLPMYFLPNPFPAHFFLNRSWIDVDNMPLKYSKQCDETVNYSRVWTEKKTGLPLTIAIRNQCHSKIIFLHLHAAFIFYLVIWK